MALRKQRSGGNIFGDGATAPSLDGSHGPVRQRTRQGRGSLTLFHTTIPWRSLIEYHAKNCEADACRFNSLSRRTTASGKLLISKKIIVTIFNKTLVSFGKQKKTVESGGDASAMQKADADVNGVVG